MTELLFSDIQSEATCPLNSFVVQDGKLILDVGTFIGENVTGLTSTKYAEMVFKLARLGRYAQLTKNAGGGTPLSAGSQVNSFDNPLFTTPTINAGNDTVTTNGSITVRVAYSFNPNDALIANI